MAKNKPDRRVERTRRSLQDAIVALILEKGYNAVTLQDILDRANVGRSTFYAHYRDKEELLLSCFESLRVAFEEHANLVLAYGPMSGTQPDAQVNLLPFILKYVEHEHRLFKALMGKRSGGIPFNYARDYFLKYSRGILKNVIQNRSPAYQLEAVAQYFVNTLLTLLVWWVDNDLPCSSEELYVLVTRLIEPGLIDVLGIPSLWPLSSGTTTTTGL